MKIREISISITDNCNCRCTMCNIWNRKDRGEFNIDFIDQLPPGLKSITLAGGEPFLRRDIPLIVKRIKCRSPKSRIVITTNGILTDVIVKDVLEILKIDPKVAIRISLDGMRDTHDLIRGYAGAYQRVIDTQRLLKGIGVRDLDIHITLSNMNIKELQGIYRLASQEKIKFNCQVAHSSDFYFSQENEELRDKPLLGRELKRIINSELKTFDPYRLFKAYYYQGIWDYVNHLPRGYKCRAGSLYCYLDSQGDVYPCIMLKEKMGSLKENNFSRIWFSQEAEEVRKKVKNCTKNCWLICTAAPEIKDSPAKAFLWILGHKLKSHLGLYKISPFLKSLP